MKKTLTSLLILFACIPFAHAQKGFQAGIQGAYNAVFIINQNAWGGQELDYTATTGFAYGIEAGYNFDRHFGLQLEGDYTWQGQHYKQESATAPTIYRNIDLNYVQVPLLLKYCSGSQYPARFYVMAGPQYGMLQAASLYYKDANTTYTIDARNRYEKVDWSAVFEFGVDVKIIDHLCATGGIRFNYGLNDINAPEYRVPNHSGIYNMSRNAWGGINIGVHYAFGS